MNLLSSLLLLLLGLNSHGILCHGFATSSLLSQQTRQGSRRITSFLNDENEEETNEEKPKSKDSEPISLFELAEMEAKASKRIDDRLLLPYRLGETITNLAWSVVLASVLLNGFGYAFIRDANGFISIGTIEERNFRLEMNKGTREAMEKSADAATRNQNAVDPTAAASALDK